MTKVNSKPGAVTPKVEPATSDSEPITPHTEVLTVEQYKEGYVAKFDQNKANIKKLGDKLKKITIAGIDDKKNYELVKSIKTDVATALRVTEDTRVGLKEPHLRRGQAIDSYAKELEGPLRELKALADSKLKAIDDAKQAEKNRKETEAKELLDERMAELKEAGLQFDGDYYSIGQIAVDLVTVSKFTDKQYAGLLAGVKEAKETQERLEQEEKERKEEEARQLKEAQDKLLAEQQEQRRKEEELNARIAEIERKEKEAKDKEIAGRQRALQAAGLSFVVMDALYLLDTKSGSVQILQKDVEELDEKQWDLVLATIQEDSRAIAVKEEARLKELEDIKIRTRQREAQLIALGLNSNTHPGHWIYIEPKTGKELQIKFFEVESIGDTAWAPRLKSISEGIDGFKKEALDMEDQRLAKEEEQRKLSLSDGQAIEEYLLKFKVDKPVLKVLKNQEALDHFTNNVARAMQQLQDFINK